MIEPNPEPSFTWKDAAILLVIFVFGGLGYLCDIHSPLVLTALPFFGSFFVLALLALGGLCIFQVLRRPKLGCLAGTALAVLSLGIVLWLFLVSSRP